MLDDVFNADQNTASANKIVGFQTARGSMYRYDPETQTAQRLKVSSGDGRGKLSHPHACYFVHDWQADYLKTNFPYMISRWRYRLATQIEGEHPRLVTGNEVNLPEGGKRVLCIFDRDKNEYAFSGELDTDGPAVGLTPVEKSYTTDESTGKRMGSTHIGNPVVKVYTNDADFKADLAIAYRRLETPNYTTDTDRLEADLT
ncbi:MAG: hypothetical protein ACPGRX_06330 [Bdellovibrionales bacterium]